LLEEEKVSTAEKCEQIRLFKLAAEPSNIIVSLLLLYDYYFNIEIN